MEEDSGVKAAPVTRLRRRLSVEIDDTKSPSAPSTPTKKRSTRLAAKPQLELIDEHAVTNSPKRTTRKSISRDIGEPEEKKVTPARRSARVKSNTSLVSDPEERPLTPARRNSRIKSNTSIVSEAAQIVESPRAMRAIARRNSQVGSDTEVPLTPARTRRTRQASTSSIDKEETPSVTEITLTPGRTRRTRRTSTSRIDASAEASQDEKPSLITEVIAEEPEGKVRKSKSNDIDNYENDSPTRKSPRLEAKKNRTKNTEDINESSILSQEINEQNENEPNTAVASSQEEKAPETVPQYDVSVSNLIKDVDIQVKKKSSNKNKSMSSLETLETKKRNRTKSWTTLCSSPVDGNFYSDNESAKKKLKKDSKIYVYKKHSDSGSGDGPNEIHIEQNTNEVKLNNKESRNSFNPCELDNQGKSMSEVPKEIDINNESNKENLHSVAPVRKESSAVELLFEHAPSADVKSIVFIEDSDSNNSNMAKIDKQLGGEDQCVPVVLHQSVNHVTSSEKSENTDETNIFTFNDKDENNDSVEPMDIDETMVENVSQTGFAEEAKKPHKSSLCVPQETDGANTIENPNIVKRKSSVLHSTSQILEECSLKDEENPSKQPRKSSISIIQELNDSFKEVIDKSKRKSSLSKSISEDDRKESNKSKSKSVENQNDSVNESELGKNKRKSSLSSTEAHNKKKVNKSKRKSYLSENDSQRNEEMENNRKEDVIIGDTVQPSTSVTKGANTTKESSNQLKRKSFLSDSISQDLGNDNKSTLVLSQIKDTSTTENVSKSVQNVNELSKSSNSFEDNKVDAVNKNIDLHYLTSTPVQQKNAEKFNMQMNSSIITSTTEIKKDLKLAKNIIQKNASILSKSSGDGSSDEDTEESVESENSPKNKNNFFDNQAEDAGDDYESGDSLDEGERQYARENEILDKGETLTSQDEISNDSDYEKDSFLVSSDEDDRELLSGSGDDLDMSDNELTLSAKSKKKYNERKLNEQKKASREMFEARHGLIKSDEVQKSKKENRSRLDSTLFKSDDEMMPPKKNKRMRLDSTLDERQHKSDTEELKLKKDISATSDKVELSYKKKKSKRLSESVCNESAMNEKEISVYSYGTTEKDPLSAHIKTELNSPQKDFEISRIHITDEVEQVHVNENASMIELNETTDPLQSTKMQDKNDSDDGSISENEEIAKNYDSMLKELNKKNCNQIKSQDNSLNLNKSNSKPSSKFIDELKVKQTKISNKVTSSQAKEKSVIRLFKKLVDTDETSSDSMNLQLLFSDESNGSDKRNSKNQKEAQECADETVIPLETKEAETDIRRSMDEADTSLNSTKTSKRRKSSKNHETQDKGEHGEETLNFFIDTKGSLTDEDKTDAVLESESDGAPVEVLYVSNKIKTSYTLTNGPCSEKKKTRLSVTQETSPTEQDIFVLKTSTSEKKSKQSAEDISMGLDSIPKTPVSEKKKKLAETLEVSVKEKIAEPKAKSVADEEEDMIISDKKRKRRTSENKTRVDISSAGTKENNAFQQLNDPLHGNKKKKLKSSIDNILVDSITTAVEEPETEITSLKKKKKNMPSTAPESELTSKVGKKRKDRDDDEEAKTSKVFKEHSFDKVHVPRLPPTVINQLDDKPRKVERTKTKVVSTTHFTVEETTQSRKNKPSNFLEETVYLNNNDKETIMKKKPKLNKPIVLPFLPTVSISDSGFTTNFHVNVISQKMEFVAQKVSNFKNDYLNDKKIKKLRTYDLYKKQRNAKLSKY